MSDPVKYTLRFMAFLLVQALILNKMSPLHQFITPSIYFLFILWLPFSISRVPLLFAGFFLGLFLDFFTKTPGLHTSSVLLVAYLRPFFISLMVPKDTRELATGSPSFQTMGTFSYILYVTFLTLMYHGWLVMLEWMSFGNFFYYVGKVFFSTLVSVALILITEIIFRRGRKTNRR